MELGKWYRNFESNDSKSWNDYAVYTIASIPQKPDPEQPSVLKQRIDFSYEGMEFEVVLILLERKTARQ